MRTALRQVLGRRGLYGAPIDLDFQGYRFFRSGASSDISKIIACSRVSPGNIDDDLGNWTSVGNNLPRIGRGRGLLIEPARTNSIRNNSGQGAVVGDVASTGVLPSFWSRFTSLTGLTLSVVGTGVESGIDYTDISLVGTPSGAGTYSILFEGSSTITATNAQAWAGSLFCTLRSGSTSGITSIALLLDEYTATPTYVRTDTVVSSLSVINQILGLSRQSGFVTTSGGATVARVLPYIQLNLNGAAVSITLRIGWPQLEAGNYASSPVRTTNAAAGRAAESAVFVILPSPFGASYSLFVSGIPLAPVTNTTAQVLASIDNGSDAQRLVVRRAATTGTSFLALQGGSGAFLSPTTVLPQGALMKAAAAVTAGDQAGALNGVLTLGTAAALPTTPTTIRLGSNSLNGELWNGYIPRIVVWPNLRLPDGVLSAITV